MNILRVFYLVQFHATWENKNSFGEEIKSLPKL